MIHALEYPKIETLFNRDPKTFKVIEEDFRCSEFKMVNQWYITEKIDGTNTRIYWHPADRYMSQNPMRVEYGGRTHRAQMYKPLLDYLKETFTYDNMMEVFPPDLVNNKEAREALETTDLWNTDIDYDPREFSSTGPRVVLFGEGYGPKIQKGGNYRLDISFRLFDVYIYGGNPLGGWWLEPENIQDIADKFGIDTAPYLGTYSTEGTIEHVKALFPSQISSREGGNQEYLMEGIVARTKPMLFTRRGKRLMWKLKVKDFQLVAGDKE